MDVSEFFNTVVKPNYQEFTRRSDDFRLLWNAIISMNTVAEHVALERLQYASVSREVLARTANQIRDKDLDELKYCAEALKHVRKIEALKHVRNNIEDVKIFAGGQGFVTITSSHVSANDRATWTIGSHNLVDVAQRAFKTLSALPELS
jgi:predicted RNA-binding protein with EMAP domain